MKSSVKKAAKLELARQTIRALSQVELAEIAGGANSANIQSCPNPRPAPSFCV